MRNANYQVERENHECLIIRDLGPWDKHGTVTNDAERVVEELAPRLAGRRLFYYDSEGALDEILVRDGKFAGFKFFGQVIET